MKKIVRFQQIWILVGVMLSLALVESCHKNCPPESEPGDLIGIPYNPQPYTIMKPDHFPPVPVPENNSMTVAGVQLGRRLFYDPILSADSTMSCSSCHLPAGSFTDNKAVSKGVDGIAGRRSSMSLLNVAYITNGLFWDGRAATLEDQALKPVEDVIELHEQWPNVVEKLKNHPTYPTLFREAFGIIDRDSITKELAAMALAQFERILISSGNSKFDEFNRGNVDIFDEEELDGKLMYFDEGAPVNLPDAQCFHCHGGITLTGNNFFNNGLDSVGALEDFIDKGRGEVTGNRNDFGEFRAPTMRNIALTAPFMHDGRFQTLYQAVSQYSDNGFGVENENIFIGQIGFPLGGGKYAGFTEYHKNALVKFLHTLTDTTFINNPDIQNPF